MAELPSERLFGDYGEWPGRDVLDSSGDRLGDVREIYLDRDTGRPEWVLVEVADDQPRFVPLADASVEASAIRVAHTASVVRAAPTIGPEAHIDNDQERKLYEHYGIRYSEAQSDSGLPANVSVAPAAKPDDVPPEDTASAEAAAAGAGPHAPVPGEEHAPAGDEQATAEMPAAAEPGDRWSGADAPSTGAEPVAGVVPQGAPAADVAPAAETAPPPAAVEPEEPAPPATPGLPQTGPPEPPAFAPEEPPATPGLPEPEPPQPEPPRAFPPPPPPPEPGGGKLALTGGKRRLGLAGGAAVVAAALFLVVRRLRS